MDPQDTTPPEMMDDAELKKQIQDGERIVAAHVLQHDPLESFLAWQKMMNDEPYPHFTDLGNAQWLCGRDSENIRFCHVWGQWLIWDHRRWATDKTGEIDRRAKETVKSMYTIAGIEKDSAIRKGLADHARKSEADGKIKAMIHLAQTETGIPVTPEMLDKDPMLLNVLNGTVDLKTGNLHPHCRENLITKLAPVEYCPDAKCLGWYAFLARILADNEQVMSFVQRSVGYSLTGFSTEQCLFLLHGQGMNGKSTFLQVLRYMLGDYGQQATFDTFLTRDRGGIPNDLARLAGARLVVAVEADMGRKLAESIVKQLTGGDKITARFLHQEFFEFNPTLKLWLACNHKPTIRGNDDAIWRRIRLIPFTVKIPETERNLGMVEHLKDELPGILAWAVKGCLEWQRVGLQTPNEVNEATARYRSDMDTIGEFLDECCVIEQGAFVPKGKLYDAYKTWTGDKEYITKQTFGTLMAERGFEDDRKAKGKRIWLGLKLKECD